MFSSPLNSQKVLQYPSHRILRYVYGALNIDEKKLIAQFGWKLRDERFEPNQSTIEHYLPSKNEKCYSSPNSKIWATKHALTCCLQRRGVRGSELTN